MSLLSDLATGFLELLMGGGGPDDRGLLLLATLSGFCLACVNGWLVLSYPNPLREPSWGFAAIVAGIVLGSAGVILDELHLVRLDEHRGLSAIALVLNVAAVAVTLVSAL